MNNLNYLESEAIHIIREMISESENPVFNCILGFLKLFQKAPSNKLKKLLPHPIRFLNE